MPKNDNSENKQQIENLTKALAIYATKQELVVGQKKANEDATETHDIIVDNQKKAKKLDPTVKKTAKPIPVAIEADESEKDFVPDLKSEPEPMASSGNVYVDNLERKATRAAERVDDVKSAKNKLALMEAEDKHNKDWAPALKMKADAEALATDPAGFLKKILLEKMLIAFSAKARAQAKVDKDDERIAAANAAEARHKEADALREIISSTAAKEKEINGYKKENAEIDVSKDESTGTALSVAPDATFDDPLTELNSSGDEQVDILKTQSKLLEKLISLSGYDSRTSAAEELVNESKDKDKKESGLLSVIKDKKDKTSSSLLEMSVKVKTLSKLLRMGGMLGLPMMLGAGGLGGLAKAASGETGYKESLGKNTFTNMLGMGEPTEEKLDSVKEFESGTALSVVPDATFDDPLTELNSSGDEQVDLLKIQNTLLKTLVSESKDDNTISAAEELVNEKKSSSLSDVVSSKKGKLSKMFGKKDGGGLGSSIMDMAAGGVLGNKMGKGGMLGKAGMLSRIPMMLGAGGLGTLATGAMGSMGGLATGAMGALGGTGLAAGAAAAAPFLAGAAALAAIGGGGYMLWDSMRGSDESKDALDAAEEAGVVEHNIFGDSTVLDWNKVKAMKPEVIQALADYDDWDSETENRFDEILNPKAVEPDELDEDDDWDEPWEKNLERKTAGMAEAGISDKKLVGGVDVATGTSYITGGAEGDMPGGFDSPLPTEEKGLPAYKGKFQPAGPALSAFGGQGLLGKLGGWLGGTSEEGKDESTFAEKAYDYTPHGMLTNMLGLTTSEDDKATGKKSDIFSRLSGTTEEGKDESTLAERGYDYTPMGMMTNMLGLTTSEDDKEKLSGEEQVDILKTHTDLLKIISVSSMSSASGGGLFDWLSGTTEEGKDESTVAEKLYDVSLVGMMTNAVGLTTSEKDKAKIAKLEKEEQTKISRDEASMKGRGIDNMNETALNNKIPSINQMGANNQNSTNNITSSVINNNNNTRQGSHDGDLTAQFLNKRLGSQTAAEFT